MTATMRYEGRRKPLAPRAGCSLDDGEPDSRKARIEVLDPPVRPPRKRGRVVLVVLGPAHEAPAERVPQASGAVTGVAGIHVLAAGAQVVLEASPAAPICDRDGAGR